MKFSQSELELAQLLKAYGLEWTPQCGQYVLDQSGLIEQESPFQPNVFFILDLKHFLRRAGTLEELKQRMCWLPDWQDARQLLQTMGVTSADVRRRLLDSQALENQTERLELYRLLEEHMTASG